ncbi:hypothetical protein K432DRAFT_218328 [Lepidopterella palustris CBS 459.81]|uniref:Uncharacterized protein n=1 Tax=Lepidopterella palustris CBS 459.81 TaxID=1314670 RepID=A0A8E2EEK0_9PEZI|nr:hypothetical protein K432DRAFT_218328 [Lepidopterella palustris CBS 459.81]
MCVMRNALLLVNAKFRRPIQRRRKDQALGMECALFFRPISFRKISRQGAKSGWRNLGKLIMFQSWPLTASGCWMSFLTCVVT